MTGSAAAWSWPDPLLRPPGGTPRAFAAGNQTRHPGFNALGQFVHIGCGVVVGGDAERKIARVAQYGDPYLNMAIPIRTCSAIGTIGSTRRTWRPRTCTGCRGPGTFVVTVTIARCGNRISARTALALTANGM